MASSTRPVALVTGATAGIGSAAAEALAQAGFTVVGTGRKTAGLTPPKGTTLLDLDVTDDNSVAAAISMVVEQHGRIDVLVNNAGIGSAGAGEENSATRAQQVYDVNVFGVMRMTKAVLPQMRAQASGRIVNVSSVLGFVPAPFGALYASSKHAVEGYSESVDHEVRQHGIRVLLVEPGFTKTGFDTARLMPDSPLSLYVEQRRVADEIIVESLKAGDPPAVVAAAIVAAATDKKPKQRYPAGKQARRLSQLRRLVPSGPFYKQIRKFNRLPG